MRLFKLFPNDKELEKILDHPSYFYCRCMELVELINKNNKTKFRDFNICESPADAAEHLNNMIDFINTKHQLNISHIYLSMSYDCE